MKPIAFDQGVLDKYRSGMSARALAREYKCSAHAILDCLRRNDVKRRNNSEDKIVDVPDIVAKRYLVGRKVADLAKDVGCCPVTIYKFLKNRGIELEKRTKPKLKKKDKLPRDAITAAYHIGASIKSLAERHGATRSRVQILLKKAGVNLRTQSEQALCDARRSTPEARIARVKAANDARRGSKRPEDELRQAALARQQIGAQTVREIGWAAVFARSGIETVPQFAFQRWNIDLAVPSAKVAIEVQNGWHSAKGSKHKINDEAKFAALEKEGWMVVALYDKHLGGNVHQDAVVAIRRRMGHGHSPSSLPPNVASPTSMA